MGMEERDGGDWDKRGEKREGGRERGGGGSKGLEITCPLHTRLSMKST
jgi:hypothetical protein